MCRIYSQTVTAKHISVLPVQVCFLFEHTYDIYMFVVFRDTISKNQHQAERSSDTDLHAKSVDIHQICNQ